MIVLVCKKCLSLGLKYQQIWRQKCQNQTEESCVFTHVHVAVPFQCQGAGLAQWCAAFCAAGSESDSQLFTLKCKFFLVLYGEWKFYMIWL